MILTRVIPVLLTMRQGLYKGVRFKNHKYVGDPINAVKIFNEKEVDELIILDIEATRSKTAINFEHIRDIVSEAFMPVGYGGGIHSIETAQKLFSIGIEKIIINSAAHANPQLITAISQTFGSQSVVISVDVKKNWLGRYVLYSHAGTRKHKINLAEHLELVEQAGAGEIIVNNIAHDGRMQGYDLDLISSVSAQVGVPLIAGCGAGSLQDFHTAISAGATAVAAGSFFVFYGPHRAVLISYPQLLEMEALWQK